MNSGCYKSDCIEPGWVSLCAKVRLERGGSFATAWNGLNPMQRSERSNSRPDRFSIATWHQLRDAKAAEAAPARSNEDRLQGEGNERQE